MVSILSMGVVAVLMGPAEPRRAAVEPARVLTDRAEVLDSARARACPAQASALTCAQGLLDIANERRKARQPWYSDLMQEAAEKFVSANALPEAIDAYGQLERFGETPTRRAYAAFKGGELLRISDKHGDAVAAFDRCTALIATYGVERDAALYARACLAQGASQRKLGRRSEAIETRSRVLGQAWTASLPVNLVGSAYVENARDRFALGQLEQGRASFDAFFAAYPGEGADDGRRVLWKVEQALAGRSPGAIMDADTSDRLSAIWNDPATADEPESMVSAANLSDVLRNRKKYDDCREVAGAARARFVAHQSAWSALPASRFETAREMFETVTMTHAQLLEQAGDLTGALQALVDLLNRYPKCESAALALESIERIMGML